MKREADDLGEKSFETPRHQDTLSSRFIVDEHQRDIQKLS
jgi:hypothetical protein